jgi:hypothetical protein
LFSKAKATACSNVKTSAELGEFSAAHPKEGINNSKVIKERFNTGFPPTFTYFASSISVGSRAFGANRNEVGIEKFYAALASTFAKIKSAVSTMNSLGSRRTKEQFSNDARISTSIPK